MGSNYIIEKTQSSFCPNCNQLVYLMSDKDGIQCPSFYICWNCKSVAEIAKGPVGKQRVGSNRIKCPHCDSVIIIPEGWTEEAALQDHLDTKYENVKEMIAPGLCQTSRRLNPCYEKKIRKEKGL